MRCALAIVTVAWFAAGLAPSASAHAAEESLPVSLVYEAAPGCPSKGDFFEEMRARAPRVRAALASERAYGVRLRLAEKSGDASSTGATLAGQVALVDLEGHEATRRLEGSSCLDVARALALVAVLDMGGVALLPTVPAEPAEHDGTTPRAKGDAMVPAPGPGAARAVEAAAHWLPSVSIHGGLRTGVAPDVMPSATMSFVLDRDASRLASEFRVSASYSGGDTSGARASVALHLTAMAFDACVPRVDVFNARVSLMPCARLEAGVHTGELQPGLGAKSALWIAPGLVGRMRAAAAGSVFVEAEISGLFPLLYTRFFEGDGSVPVFATPWLVAGAAVGAGTTFP